MDNCHVGTAVGFGTGLYKAIAVLITTTTFAALTWQIVLEAAILALIGGAAGWLGAELVKQIKNLYLRTKKKYGKNKK